MSSIINYVADGSTSTFQIPFNFIDRAHVVVTVDGTTITPTFINDAQLSISPTPTSGLKITVKRETPVGALVDFTDGSTLFEADLDLAHKQNRFIAEESSDRADSAIDTLNANITNINTVATDTVAINTVSGSITNVNTVATNMAEVLLADTNAATATTKASEASVSATASEASKVISVTKAGEASASAASALASKNAAATSETNAAGSAATATTQANLATTNGATQVALATNQVSLATDQANLATTNGAAQVTLATAQTSLATTQANNSANSASTASTQAGIATTKASEASASASAAAASAASITDEEANAAASAAASAGSATASANSAAASAAALDTFDDRYLGSKTANPTLDNDGDALVAGALYFNSTANEMRVYDGANWIAASSSGVASMNLYEYTATSGQTTFTGADDNSNSISFIAGNEIVVLNGVILDPSDYNSSSGTSIVLASGAATGDLLNVYAFKSFTVADTVSASTGGTFGGNIDVTGTVTADAYALDNIALPSAGTATIFNRNTDNNLYIQTDSGNTVNLLDGGQNTMYAVSPTSHIFQISNAEKMRIDASGNLLLGKTSDTYSVAGASIRANPSGVLSGATVTRDGANVVSLNRLTNDGDILTFSKDTTTVGSIGTIGSKLTIGSGATGVRFNYAGVDTISPWNTSTNALTNGTTSLGYTGTRFKDLYLSGKANVGSVATSSAGTYSTNHVGVHAGGVTLNAATGTTGYIMSAGSSVVTFAPTGAMIQLGGLTAANALDDYESGDWVPVVAGLTLVAGQTTAKYVKVGSFVFFSTQFQMPSTTSSTHMYIAGLPFLANCDSSATMGYTTSPYYNPAMMVQGSTTYFYKGGGSTHVQSEYSNSYIRLSGHYNTAA